MNKVQKLGTILERYDRIMLPRRKISVNLTAGRKRYSAKASLGGKSTQITIEVPDDEIQSLVVAKAANLHELGHAIYTRNPKRHLSWYQLQALNLLEDQRVETILAKKYKGMRKYFVTLVANRRRHSDSSYDPAIMEWGRRFFLPYKVNEPEPEIRKVIDSYLTAKTADEREELAIKFAEIMNRNVPSVSSPQNSTSSKKDTPDEQNSANMVQEQVDSEKQEKKEKQERQVKREQERASGQDEESKENEGDNETEADRTGQGAGDSIKSEVDKLEESLQETLEELIAQAVEELSADLNVPLPKNRKNVLQKISGKEQAAFSINRTLDTATIGYWDTAPVVVDHNLVQQLYQIFRSSKLELGSAWNRHQRKGRLDIRQAMRAGNSGNLRIFRQYQPSNIQDSKMSLVLLYDVSGSMRRNDPMQIELKSVAALTQAATMAGNEVACIEFDYNASISKSFYGSDLKMSCYTGGTKPLKAINKFREVKGQANHPVVLILMTDGEFRENLSDVVEGVRMYKIAIGRDNMRRAGGNWIKVRDTSRLPTVLKAITTDVEHRIKEALIQ